MAECKEGWNNYYSQCESVHRGYCIVPVLTFGPNAQMMITLSSDYLYVLAMLKTTPLVVTLGISLTIPLALLGDYFLTIQPTVQALLGACLVLASFVAVGVKGYEAERGDSAS
jgi:hypothetical protein